MTTTTIFACTEHAPFAVAPLPYDDGRPTCEVCGTTNYAVKPFMLPAYVVDKGWRTVSYEVATRRVKP